MVELAPILMPGADRDLVKVWGECLPGDRILLQTGVVAAAATAVEGIEVTYSSGERVLRPRAGRGRARAPNGRKLATDKAGVVVNERGSFIPVDSAAANQRAAHFAIGDIVGRPINAHKGVHEGARRRRERLPAANAVSTRCRFPSVRLYRPGNRLGRQDRGNSAGQENPVRQGTLSTGGVRAAPWPTGARRGFTKTGEFDEAATPRDRGGIVGLECRRPDRRSLRQSKWGCDRGHRSHHPLGTRRSANRWDSRRDTPEGVCTRFAGK